MDDDGFGAVSDGSFERLPDAGLGQFHVRGVHARETRESLHHGNHLQEHLVGLRKTAPMVHQDERSVGIGFGHGLTSCC